MPRRVCGSAGDRGTSSAGHLEYDDRWCTYDKHLYRLGKLVRGAKYPVNEVVVCRTLQLKPTEALSSHKLLSKLLEVAKRGKAGSNKDGWDTIAHRRIDLSDEENSLGVVMLRSGQRQSFKSSSLTTHTEVSVHPRWFIPAKQYRPKAFIAPKHVVQIVRLLTRDDSWLACIQGNGGAANESKLKPFLDELTGMVDEWDTFERVKADLLFAIAAEADASEFMEVTSHFHKQGGTAGRAGFALDRVHALYLDYAVPFWERAIVDWKTRFKRSARVFTELSPASQVLYDKKMKVGAQAAHDEIAAMLRKLMSAPLIFLLLRDPDRGGALCRALHHVLKDAFDFGVGWESYGIASVRPLFEAKLIGLLELDLNNTRHFFQQFGLARAVTLPDLCALGKEPPGQRTSRKVFRGKYPVLDDALEAVYHLCPSSSLLAEQAHGMLRNTMKSHDSLEMTDLKMAHKMNNAYGVRRKVRQAKQESEERNDRASGTEGGGRAAKRRKESTKLHERKEDSQRQAQLLLESLSRYAQSAVDAMPGLPTVKSLRKTGLKRLDNDARTRQEEAAATTRARRTRQPRTDADWAAAASQVQVKNDQDWVHPDEDRRKKDTKRFVEMPLWNKMRKPKMIEDLNKVFTTFHVDVVEDWKGKTKKDILLLIQEHIKKVGRVVAREESNTLLPTVSVADMSRDEAMAVFVNADGSDVLCTERAERGRTAAAMKEVFRLCGQTCNDMICESIQ